MSTEVIRVFLSNDNRDTTMLEPIYSDLLKSDNTALHKLVDKFIVQLPHYLKRMDASIVNNDVSELKNILHSMKGIAGNYGFTQLYDECLYAEKILDNSEREINEAIANIKITAERIMMSANHNEKSI